MAPAYFRSYWLRAMPDPASLLPKENIHERQQSGSDQFPETTGVGGLPMSSSAATVIDDARRSQDWPATESQLFRRVAQGDREAFGELYDHYATPLYSFIVRILDDPIEASEVMQEVFLKIWEAAPSFDESLGRPSSWAVTLARTVAIDRLRARPQGLRVLEEIAGSTSWPDTGTAIRPFENGRRGQSGHGGASLHRLPDDQRRPIELALFVGLSDIEIAWALERPFGAVKTCIQHGMVRLREELEGQAGPAERLAVG